MPFLTASALNPWPLILVIVGLVCLALAILRTRNYLQYRKRRRSRKHQKLDHLTIALYAIGTVVLLCSIFAGINASLPPSADESQPISGGNASETTGPTGESTEPTGPVFGWMTDEGGIYYLREDGTRATGWLDLELKRYYLNENGYTLSGWQDLEGITRYFRPDGSMARGEEEIDGIRHFFAASGQEILVANPWNYIPDGYEVELTELSVVYSTEGCQVAASIYDDLMAMLKDCNDNSGSRCCVVSGFRTHEFQTSSYESLVQDLINNEGKTEADARAEAATRIAVPGTSEHQLGLAVDIIDTQLWALELEQENLPAQKWLMEHCWEYGFILRYPKDKTDITGIIYEPWHYRYVGRDLAKEITDLGLTLEEYLDSLE